MRCEYSHWKACVTETKNTNHTSLTVNRNQEVIIEQFFWGGRCTGERANVQSRRPVRLSNGISSVSSSALQRPDVSYRTTYLSLTHSRQASVRPAGTGKHPSSSEKYLLVNTMFTPRISDFRLLHLNRFIRAPRYYTRCNFNVCSKADISQLNLPHATQSWY